MASYTANVVWTLKGGEDFPKGRYGRAHSITFDGGTMMPGSASPHVVGAWADPAAVDPEEMLVAALSSCHMLTFLHVARLAGFEISVYRDHAEGEMEEIAPCKQAVTQVTLRPEVEWVGLVPDKDRLSKLHHEAHGACFITNSVKTKVTIEAQ